VGNGCIAASLACLALVVHDLAHTQTTATALVQVAEYANPDKREIAATTRAPHVSRERVKQHGKLWQPIYTPNTGATSIHLARRKCILPATPLSPTPLFQTTGTKFANQEAHAPTFALPLVLFI
jgi:hypothetical protein